VRRIALLLAVALGAGACSVSTPRRESAAVRAAGLRQQAAAEGAANADTAAVVDGAATELDAGTNETTAGSTSAKARTTAIKAASASGANRAASAVGVTKDTITVSVIAGFSGALAAMVGRAYDGLLTWQDDVNAAGGINGRRVILKQVDHKETADGGVAACKQALSNGSFMAIVPEGVDATLTAVSCLDAAGMPTLYYSATTDPKWKVAFADVVTSSLGGQQMASYVRNTLGGASKKAGVIYVNQASYTAMNDAFVGQARKLAQPLANSEPVEPNQASFTAPLLRLKNAGVQILIISATTDAVGILRDAKSMGWHPQLTGWGFQFDFLTTAARALFVDVAALRGYAAVDAAAYAQYSARMTARGRGRGRSSDLEGFSAYGHALMLGEVLKRAGANPTRATLVAGMESIKGYDNGILGPITWSATDHVGTHSTFPVVCCSDDNTWRTAGPPRTAY
jgi:ABC-type branched-subunit amino acid transport system substrate-binding protein